MKKITLILPLLLLLFALNYCTSTPDSGGTNPPPQPTPTPSGNKLYDANNTLLGDVISQDGDTYYVLSTKGYYYHIDSDGYLKAGATYNDSNNKLVGTSSGSGEIVEPSFYLFISNPAPPTTGQMPLKQAFVIFSSDGTTTSTQAGYYCNSGVSTEYTKVTNPFSFIGEKNSTAYDSTYHIYSFYSYSGSGSNSYYQHVNTCTAGQIGIPQVGQIIPPLSVK